MIYWASEASPTWMVQSSCTVLVRCARPTHALHAPSSYYFCPTMYGNTSKLIMPPTSLHVEALYWRGCDIRATYDDRSENAPTASYKRAESISAGNR